LWIYLLGNVTRSEMDYIVGSQKVKLSPGQIIIGRKRLAQEMAMSQQNIITCLNLLKKFGNITIKSTNKYSVLTIINWTLYQQTEKQTTNNPTKSQPAPNQQLTTKQEYKNKENVRSYKIQCEELVQYLNKISGRRFTTEGNVEYIVPRLKRPCDILHNVSAFR